MFIQIGENIYAKDAIASIKVENKTTVVVYPKNPRFPSDYDTFGFNSHSEAMEEMLRIYEILQKKA